MLHFSIERTLANHVSVAYLAYMGEPPLKRDHVSDAVRSLNWLSAAALYQYSAVTRFRAVLRTGEPLSLSSNIVSSSDIHNHNTRGSNQFRQPPVQIQIGKRTFAFSAPGLYNSLPQSVRETGGGFKAALKEHLLNLALTLAPLGSG